MMQLRITLAALLCLVLAGCANVSGMRAEDALPANTLQVTGKTYDEVWTATMKAVRARQDLQLVEADRNTGTIRAESAGGVYRHNLAVFITSAAPGSTGLVVRAVSGQKGGPVQLTNYAAAILMNLRADLGML